MRNVRAHKIGKARHASLTNPEATAPRNDAQTPHLAALPHHPMNTFHSRLCCHDGILKKLKCRRSQNNQNRCSLCLVRPVLVVAFLAPFICNACPVFLCFKHCWGRNSTRKVISSNSVINKISYACLEKPLSSLSTGNQHATLLMRVEFSIPQDLTKARQKPQGQTKGTMLLKLPLLRSVESPVLTFVGFPRTPSSTWLRLWPCRSPGNLGTTCGSLQSLSRLISIRLSGKTFCWLRLRHELLCMS